MDFTTACRTCLQGDYLNPIFPNLEDWRRYSNALYITTGLKIEPNDGLPQQICSLCLHIVNQSLKFRKTCKDAQHSLLDNFKKQDNNLNYCNKKKDFIVFSGVKPNVENEIHIEPEDLNTEYTKNEILSYEEDGEKPSKCYIEDLDDTQEIKTNKTNIVTKVSNPDLYMLNDSSEFKTRRVVCKLCQKNLSIRSIDAHMNKAHPGADERKTKCELCDSYLIKQKLNRHMNMKHGMKKGQEKNFGRCAYCNTEFDSKETLIKHVENCTHKKKKRRVCESSRQIIQCDVCNKKMQKASLRLHKATAHAGMKPVCEYCGRAFGNRFRLKEHYRAKHGYEKFKCTYCEFETAGAMSLQNHLRRHRGEKPFACDTCDAKFHAAYLLAQHRQSHRTDRPLKCDQCSASFKASNNLHMHKKACHGPALYKCAACPRSYSSRHYAVKHMRRAHRFTGPLPPLRENIEENEQNQGEVVLS